MTHPSSSIRIALAGLVICLSLLAWSVSMATAGTHDSDRTVLYVATNGNDQWTGQLPAPNANRQDGPFATLTAARDAIRRLKATNRQPGAVEVMVLEGTYHLREPFVLTSEDTGSEKQPITYTAYPGHHPVFSGGKVIQNWKPSVGKIIESHLPDVKAGRWKFRQLFFRGQRQTRARWPNQDPADPLYGGWALIEPVMPKDSKESATHRYAADQAPRQWANPEQAEVNVFPWYCWVNDILPHALPVSRPSA